MDKRILNDAEARMKKVLEVYRKDIASIRAGRANPAMLDKVMVDYYGQPTPVSQVAKISVVEARVLLIQPWDKNMVSAVERAILKSDLGINPVVDANGIRLVIPPLTKERREEIAKGLRKKAEEQKVAIRNVRRDANEQVKKLEKNKEISEDDADRALKEIQELTDKYIGEIEKATQVKEKEIMEV
ncbi:MAG TPA: ribosome recycling factor [Firmicutes bacterium]|nr:ribosome recycling factor [Bacillota bacterium]